MKFLTNAISGLREFEALESAVKNNALPIRSAQNLNAGLLLLPAMKQKHSVFAAI